MDGGSSPGSLPLPEGSRRAEAHGDSGRTGACSCSQDLGRLFSAVPETLRSSPPLQMKINGSWHGLGAPCAPSAARRQPASASAFCRSSHRFFLYTICMSSTFLCFVSYRGKYFSAFFPLGGWMGRRNRRRCCFSSHQLPSSNKPAWGGCENGYSFWKKRWIFKLLGDSDVSPPTEVTWQVLPHPDAVILDTHRGGHI